MSDPLSLINDYLHSVLGYSENTMEKYILRIAQQKHMKSATLIAEELVDKLNLPGDNPKTAEISEKLFKHFQYDL